jgi:hypothetical protein
MFNILPGQLVVPRQTLGKVSLFKHNSVKFVGDDEDCIFPCKEFISFGGRRRRAAIHLKNVGFCRDDDVFLLLDMIREKRVNFSLVSVLHGANRYWIYTKNCAPLVNRNNG